MDGDTVPGRLRVLAAYHPLLVRLARRQGAGAEAEDIASDALLLAALRGQVHTDAPLAYLSRIIDNLVIDRFRAEALRDRRYCRDTAPAPRALDDLVATRDLAARVLDEQLLRQEYRQLAALQACLAANGFETGDFPSEDTYVERRDEYPNLFALNTEAEWERARTSCPQEMAAIEGGPGR